MVETQTSQKRSKETPVTNTKTSILGENKRRKQARSKKVLNSNRVACHSRDPSLSAMACAAVRVEKAVNSDCVEPRNVVCLNRQRVLRCALFSR